VKGAGLVALAWALLLFVIYLPMPTIFDAADTPTLIASASVLACALVGAALWLRRGRLEAEDPDLERPVTDVSVASATIGIAIAVIALGVQFSIAIVAVGVGLLVLGIAGVVRELQTERRFR
jgi:hypothetical protein